VPLLPDPVGVGAVSWTKISDDFSDDCWTLSDAAFRLHVEGLVWSNRKLLDNRVPVDDLRRFARTPDALEELLAVGWWTREGDVLVIRHHAGYQHTRDQVLKRQAANAANGRKGGRPKTPRERVETDSVSESKSQHGTRRDGTGRDRKGSTKGPTTEAADNVVEWPEVEPHLRTLPGSA
jgi:hypothetical protein